MLHIVLLEPEIPQNAGNVVRTAAATGSVLHLVEPLGFSLDEKHLKRAGLDYWDKARIVVHKSVTAFFSSMEGGRVFFFSSKGHRRYDEISYQDGDYLVFGKESVGIDEALLKEHEDDVLRIPMLEGIRCLNLSNAVALVAYEALRQNGFPGFRMEGTL